MCCGKSEFIKSAVSSTIGPNGSLLRILYLDLYRQPYKEVVVIGLASSVLAHLDVKISVQIPSQAAWTKQNVIKYDFIRRVNKFPMKTFFKIRGSESTLNCRSRHLCIKINAHNVSGVKS